jgi:signal transduction histidine kinase
VPLAELLRQLVAATTGRARLPVALEVDGECQLPPAVQVALYRIAQESLNNVVRHAHAEAATITLYCAPDGVTLRVADDGRGFSPDEVGHDSLGLSIMRERAARIGATLQIKSGDAGTTVLVT